jgi:hypothetical protein
VIRVKNTGLRYVLSIGAALAVIYFGSRPEDGRGVTNGVLLLAALVGVAVWYLTRPSAGKPVS